MPTDPVALGIALLAIAPGYLTVFFWARNRTWRGFTGDLHTVLAAIVLSAVVQIPLLPLALWRLYPERDHIASDLDALAIWLALSVLVIPFLLGTVSARVGNWVAQARPQRPTRKRQIWAATRWWFHPPAHWVITRVYELTPEPTAWDWLVMSGTIDGTYVVVEFADGTKVAGFYGRGGAAFTSPENHGVYLASEWALDGKGDFDYEVQNTKGVLVPDLSSVKTMHFRRGRP